MGATQSRPASISPSTVVDEKRAIAETTSSMAALQASSSGKPLSTDGTLGLNNVANWEDAVSSDPTLGLARTILSHANIRDALQRRQAIVNDVHIFSDTIPFQTNPITNQKSSGRCWLFATTNVLRYNIMKKLNLSEFQLSQNYLFFWDKLNKANYYLELSIEHADMDITSRLVYFLSQDLISDGGQWDMVVNLLEKYGVVPQPNYPESLHSSLSGPLNTLLKTKLREHALILRSLSKSLKSDPSVSSTEALATLRAKKEELLAEVYTVMSATLGVPPNPDKKFTWDYYDKDKKSKSWTGTPKEFYKLFAVTKEYNPAQSFSLINDPRNDYKKLYTVDQLGNVWGGRPVLYVNTEIIDLKNAVVKMIKAGQPVFFGCDVGQLSNRDGIMDTDLYDYSTPFNISFGLTKADRLRVHESSMTHAMVISGVHLDPGTGRPVRYRVENSWGEAAGEKGYFVMSDKWFDQFVYQVVVPKAFAPPELVAVFEKGTPVVLEPWDPMGSLA